VHGHVVFIRVGHQVVGQVFFLVGLDGGTTGKRSTDSQQDRGQQNDPD